MMVLMFMLVFSDPIYFTSWVKGETKNDEEQQVQPQPQQWNPQPHQLALASERNAGSGSCSSDQGSFIAI